MKKVAAAEIRRLIRKHYPGIDPESLKKPVNLSEVLGSPTAFVKAGGEVYLTVLGAELPADAKAELGRILRTACRDDERRKDFEDARDEENRRRTRTAAARHERWRRAARKIWADHPSSSVLRVARKIAQEGGRFNTIRQIIRTEKPALKKG